MNTLSERVADGADLLDQKRPGWAKRVNLDTLAMSSCLDCVLGQVFGEFQDGKDMLGIDYGYEFGFDLGPNDDSDGDEYYESLGELWRAEVRARTRPETV